MMTEVVVPDSFIRKTKTWEDIEQARAEGSPLVSAYQAVGKPLVDWLRDNLPHAKITERMTTSLLLGGEGDNLSRNWWAITRITDLDRLLIKMHWNF